MGRKSRHKRLKAIDPFCTGERKQGLLRKELKYENKPTNLDQPIPPSLVALQEAMESVKNPKKRKENKEDASSKVDEMNKDATDKDRKKRKFIDDSNEKVLDVTKGPRESTRHYIYRVNVAATNFIEKRKMEIKQSEGGKKKGMTDKEREKLKLRRKKLQIKKTDKRLDTLEKEFLQDKIKFGDIVQRPPEFTAIPKKGKTDNDKAGKRNLLLSHLFKSPPASTANQSKNPAKNFMRRKDMSYAEKRIFDKKREEVIEAYRQVRAKRMKLKQPRSGVS